MADLSRLTDEEVERHWESGYRCGSDIQEPPVAMNGCQQKGLWCHGYRANTERFDPASQSLHPGSSVSCKMLFCDEHAQEVRSPRRRVLP
jgi:hypothetical protein